MNINATKVAAISVFLGIGVFTAASDSLEFRIELDPDGQSRKNTPIVAEVPLPAAHGAEAGFTGVLVGPGGYSDGRKIQVERSERDGVAFARVFWIQPELRENRTRTYKLTLTVNDETPETLGFNFVDGDGHRDLRYGERPVTRHMTVYDSDRHEQTFKTYHHIFAFRNGGFLTKGSGGLYSHHRGLFLGWNQTRVGEKSWNFWRGPDGETQRHREYFPERELLGTVVARDASRTDWLDPDENLVAHDIREVETWWIDENTVLLDIDIQIRSGNAPVRLEGDPHQAGFQFRASQQVTDRQENNVFVRPESATSLPDDIWQNAAWVAGIFSIERTRYSVFHASHPGNPGPTLYSTRRYGRFGAFTEGELDEDAPLRLRYRILIKKAAAIEDISHDYFARLYSDYLNPVKVSVTPGQ